MNDIALLAVVTENGKFACSMVDSGAQKGPTGLCQVQYCHAYLEIREKV